MQQAYKKWIISVAIILAIVIAYLLLNSIQKNNLAKETDKAAMLRVKTLITKAVPQAQWLILPGNITAWHEANIYARTDGYLKKWYVDIGSQVKTGDILAEIESPEVDAQLHQAEADLNTAIANENLAKITAERWLKLVQTHFVSKQASDEKVSALKTATARVAAAQANRDRLLKLVGFEKVVAPFDGVVTSRTTDTGALINAGSNANPLFHLVQSNPLRVYVQVPQVYASWINKNNQVTLYVNNQPGKRYPAKLFETAKAIAANSRTLLTQFIVDNRQATLLPGSYAEVHIDISYPQAMIRLPVNTLLFQAAGLQVATVNAEHKVILKKVVINRDFGKEVEIKSGVKSNEQVIINPPDFILEGQTVQVVNNKS